MQTTTYYKVDDVVQWGGSTFVCNTAHTSQTDLYDDTSKWTSFVPGFNWTGAYSSGTAYKVNDLAKYGANVYICTVEHTAASTIDTSKFNVFVSGLEFEDSYNSATAYQAGDVVTYFQVITMSLFNNQQDKPLQQRNILGSINYWFQNGWYLCWFNCIQNWRCC